MNIAGTGFEWLAAPLLLFTGSDRAVFLINWGSYLLLPGLIFGVLVRLGVRRSVAWGWMWLLPAGFCYAWQASSTFNDSFATVYALAAVDFALRARQNGRPGDWWLAWLAAALLSGAKQTNLPLLLVPLVALGPGWRTLAARPWPTLAVLLVSLLVSGLPTSLLNYQHTGNWMGAMATDPAWARCVLPSPFWGVVGNTFSLTVQNLKPPLFPLAPAWNSMMARFVQTPFGSHFNSFERFGFLDHGANGASAGLGPLIVLFAVGSFLWAVRHQPVRPAAARFGAAGEGLVWWLRAAPWVALLAFMAKVGTAASARQLAPYYVLLFPALLAAPGQVRLVRRPWWRRLAATISLLTALMVLVSRNCPLFPAQTLLGRLHEKYPHSQRLAHALAAFSSHNVADLRRSAFRADIPADETVLGYYAWVMGGAEPGQWQPFGRRRVERIAPDDPAGYARSLGVRYLIVDGEELDEERVSVAEWLRRYDAELVAQMVLTIQWDVPPQTNYLARLRPAPGGAPRADPMPGRRGP